MNNKLNMWNRFKELYAARNEPEYLRPLAEIFWRSLLFIFVCGVVGVLAYALIEFWTVIDDLSAPVSGSAAPPVALDKAKLEATLNDIQARQTDSNSLQSSSPAVVDPSK